MDAADELYGLPPEEFVPARDALAKRLRAEGDREAATDVKALRRPSVTAWAINQAARAHPEALEDLLSAGEELRRVHERLVGGRADREALREAVDAERNAVSGFAAAAAEAAQAARRPLGPGTIDKIRETLHAATVDPDVRTALAAGRLEREAAAVSPGGLLAARSAPPAPHGSRRPARSGGARAPGGRASEPDRRARDRRAQGARERRAARERAEAALRDADRTVRAAEREAELRARKLELAEQAALVARDRLATAEAERAAAQGELDDGRRALRAAKGAVAAAQSALDAARQVPEG
jgi:hypothetical protein